MKLRINGEQQEFAASLSIAELVQLLGFGGKRIAVERNGEIVPRSQHASAILSDGDALEIVVAVGGG